MRSVLTKPRRAQVWTIAFMSVLGMAVGFLYCSKESRTRSVRARQLEDCLFNKDADCLFAFTPQHERERTPISAETYRKLFQALDWDAVIDVEASRATSQEIPLSTSGSTARGLQLTFNDGRKSLFGFSFSDSGKDAQVARILPSLLASFFRAKYLQDPETAGYKRFEAYRQGFNEYGDRLRQCGIVQIEWSNQFMKLKEMDAYFARLIEEAESRDAKNKR